MSGQTGLEQAGHSKFFKTFIRHSWFLVISDLPERKKYHTFENLISTDKLFAIMVSKRYVKNGLPWTIANTIFHIYAMTRKNIVCMTPQSFPIRTNMLISWHFLILRLKLFSQGVIWWVWIILDKLCPKNSQPIP